MITQTTLSPMTGRYVDTMYTLSCVDTLFGQRVNVGSYNTVEAAIIGAERQYRRCPRSTYAFQLHCNPLGWGTVDSLPVLSIHTLPHVYQGGK